MSTKAELQTVIDTNLASDQPITADLHRDTLKDNVNSILSSMYATELFDSNLTQTYFTLISPGEFSFNILKQGRKVTVSGTFTASADAALAVTVVHITDSDFAIAIGSKYFGTGIVTATPNVSRISLTNSGGITSLLINPGLQIGETIFFGVTYNTGV